MGIAGEALRVQIYLIFVPSTSEGHVSLWGGTKYEVFFRASRNVIFRVFARPVNKLSLNKKIARLRLGQAYLNEERDKKMYGFFKKFIRLIGGYVDMTTVYAVGRIINRTLGKYKFKLNEKESEARPN